MYIAKLNGRKVRNSEANTYEKCRQFIRRRIRKEQKNTSEDIKFSMGWDFIAKNPPSITKYGYSIERLAA
jgi:hypothetical protein